MKRMLILAIFALTAAGCISQNPHVPVKRHQIDESPLIATPREKPIEANIAVLDIRSRPRHEQRMLKRDAAGEITYKEYDRWVEGPNVMIGALIERALTETGAFKNVGPARTFRSARYIVDGDIISFDEVADGTTFSAVFAVRLELRRLEDNAILWSEMIEKTAPMSADTGAALSEAMSKASREAVKDAAEKIAAAAERDFSAASREKPE